MKEAKVLEGVTGTKEKQNRRQHELKAYQRWPKQEDEQVENKKEGEITRQEIADWEKSEKKHPNEAGIQLHDFSVLGLIINVGNIKLHKQPR